MTTFMKVKPKKSDGQTDVNENRVHKITDNYIKAKNLIL